MTLQRAAFFDELQKVAGVQAEFYKLLRGIRYGAAGLTPTLKDVPRAIALADKAKRVMTAGTKIPTLRGLIAEYAKTSPLNTPKLSRTYFTPGAQSRFRAEGAIPRGYGIASTKGFARMHFPAATKAPSASGRALFPPSTPAPLAK